MLGPFQPTIAASFEKGELGVPLSTPSQTQFRIRRGMKQDFAKLVALAEVLMPGEVSHAARTRALGRSLGDPDYDVLVATVGSQITGFVDLWTFSDFVEGSNISIIQNLVVEPRFRRLGTADALMRRVLNLARRRGAREVHVSTEMRNKKAISLYRRHGFTKLYAFLEKSPA